MAGENILYDLGLETFGTGSGFVLTAQNLFDYYSSMAA